MKGEREGETEYVRTYLQQRNFLLLWRDHGENFVSDSRWGTWFGRGSRPKLETEGREG